MSSHEESLNADPLYQKGLAAIRKKNYGYAVELLREVLTRHPQSIECRHNLWAAARELQHSLRQKKGSAGKNLLGSSLLRLQAWYYRKIHAMEKAIELQERLTLLNPDSIPALLRLATLFTITGNTAAARAAGEGILVLDKNHLPALKLLARIYFETKEYDLAKASASRVLEREPRNLDAENILKDIAAVDSINRGFDNITPAT